MMWVEQKKIVFVLIIKFFINTNVKLHYFI